MKTKIGALNSDEVYLDCNGSCDVRCCTDGTLVYDGVGQAMSISNGSDRYVKEWISTKGEVMVLPNTDAQWCFGTFEELEPDLTV